MAVPPRSYVDRMTMVTDVAWSRYPDGTYWVSWREDGEPKTATFSDERSAFEFVRTLDTAYAPPPPRESRRDRVARIRAEMALAELEAEMAREEEESAYRSLGSLEPYAQRRAVQVRRHPRRLQRLK